MVLQTQLCLLSAPSLRNANLRKNFGKSTLSAEPMQVLRAAALSRAGRRERVLGRGGQDELVLQTQLCLLSACSFANAKLP